MEFEMGIPVEGADVDVPMKYYDEREVLMVDSNFFDYFTFPLLEGDPEQVFTARDQIVITERLAKKLFGEKTAMNRQIRIGEGDYFTVVAVAEDPPAASTYQFNALLGFHVLEEMGYPVNSYGGTMYFNHFKLAEGTDLVAMDEAINKHVEENFDADFDTWLFMDRFDRLPVHAGSQHDVDLCQRGLGRWGLFLRECDGPIDEVLFSREQKFRDIVPDPPQVDSLGRRHGGEQAEGERDEQRGKGGYSETDWHGELSVE